MEIVKIRITQEMVNQYCLITTNSNDLDDLSDKVKYDADIKKITDKRQRSYEQLKLYWLACRYIAFNSDDIHWDNPKKVDHQIRIKCHHYESVIYFCNKHGEQQMQIIFKSISFADLTHLDACSYFDDAFKFMAEQMEMNKDEFMDAVMGSIGENIPSKAPITDKIINKFKGSEVIK